MLHLFQRQYSDGMVAGMRFLINFSTARNGPCQPSRTARSSRSNILQICWQTPSAMPCNGPVDLQGLKH